MSTDSETWTITIPAVSLPFFTTPEPITFTVPVSTLKTLLRLIVIISTYILFRPHLEKFFAKMMGRNESLTRSEVQERMKVIERETGVPIGAVGVGSRRKVVAVATGKDAASSGAAGVNARRKA